MNVYPAKINRTVRYKTTVNGRVKWRPGVITAVTDANTCTIRVGHHGETYAAIVRRTGANVQCWYTPAQARGDLNKWRPA